MGEDAGGEMDGDATPNAQFNVQEVELGESTTRLILLKDLPASALRRGGEDCTTPTLARLEYLAETYEVPWRAPQTSWRGKTTFGT